MTYKEAIDYLINGISDEAMDIAVDCIEKQIPKKPIKKTGAELGMHHREEYYYCCPICGKPVEVDDNELWMTMCYPTCECGQKIKYDWECDEE